MENDDTDLKCPMCGENIKLGLLTPHGYIEIVNLYCISCDWEQSWKKSDNAFEGFIKQATKNGKRNY